MIKVSVVLPVYNVEQYLNKCLDSLLSQTLQEIEFICVDDGSTDNSLLILKEYEKKDTRIHVLSQNNLFAGAARNNGMKIAQGEYIIFLDADDFFEKEMLEEMYEKAVQEQVDVCICGGRMFSDREQSYREAKHYLNLKLIEGKVQDRTVFTTEEIKEKIFNFISPAPWNKMFRTEMIRQNDIYFQALKRSNDLYFVYLAVACAKNIAVIPKTFVNYRVDNAQSLQATNGSSTYEFYEALSELQKQLRARGIYRNFEKSFKNRALSTCLYNLDKSRTKQDFINVAEKLKNNIFYKLGIIGHSKGYFYRKADFSRMLELYEKTPEDIWIKAHLPEVELPPVKLNIEEWQNVEDYVSSDKIKVSVIIPVYNVKQYIGECLDSLSKQSLKEIEIICVDDGSTDGTVEVLKEYQGKDSRIRIFYKENGGASSARNMGIGYASGEYIQFLDSDDMLHERALEYLYSEASRYELDILFYGAEVFFENEEVEKKEAHYRTYYRRMGDYSGVLTGQEMFRRMSEKAEFKPTPCLQIIRRDFLISSGIKFKEGMIHEDHLYTMECMALAQRTSYRDINLYYRRVRANSVMTGSKAFYHIYSRMVGIREMLVFVKNHQLDKNEEYLQALILQLERNSREAEKVMATLSEEEFFENMHELKRKEHAEMYFYMNACIKFRQELQKRIQEEKDLVENEKVSYIKLSLQYNEIKEKSEWMQKQQLKQKEEQQERIAKLEEQLKQQKLELQEKERLLKEKDSQLKEKKRQLEEKEKHLKEQQKQLRQKEEQQKKAEEKNRKLLETKKQLEEKCEQLENSISSKKGVAGVLNHIFKK